MEPADPVALILVSLDELYSLSLPEVFASTLFVGTLVVPAPVFAPILWLCEGILDKINFYLAKKQSKFTYDFVNLHQDIDPIFESFNIAFERINLYGGE